MKRLRKSRANKSLDNSWYKYGKGNQIYYSPFPTYVYEVAMCGNGSISPSPHQIKENLENLLSKENVEPHNIVKFGDGVFVTTSKEANKGIELPSGTYKYVYDNYSGIQKLVPMNFREDHYIKLPSVTDKFIKDFKDFVDSEPIYRKLNCIYKEGFLPFGSPGNGKTSTIRHLVKELMPKDAVAIVIDKDIPQNEFIQAMRNTLSERLKIFIFEEFTHFCKDSFDMEEVLSFLDGETSLDKSLIIATTNYPDALPGNIVERRSRFDKFYEFGNPGTEERKLILNHYLMRESTEEEFNLTNNMSIADIKEICLLSHKRKISTKEAIQEIKNQTKLAKDKFKKIGKLGF